MQRKANERRWPLSSLWEFCPDHVERRFVEVGIRRPWHGTVLASLPNVDWETWMAATRLAVREAQRRADLGHPLRLVGFSNGVTLAIVMRWNKSRRRQASPAVAHHHLAHDQVWLRFRPRGWVSCRNAIPTNITRFQTMARASRTVSQPAYNRRLPGSRVRASGMQPVLTFQSVLDFRQHVRNHQRQRTGPVRGVPQGKTWAPDRSRHHRGPRPGHCRRRQCWRGTGPGAGHSARGPQDSPRSEITCGG